MRFVNVVLKLIGAGKKNEIRYEEEAFWLALVKP